MKILHLDKNHPLLINGLDKAGFTNIKSYNTKISEVSKIIHEYNGIIIRSRLNLDGNLLLKAKNLKFIARVGAGTENIDINFCKKNNIKIITSPEGNRNAVAEHSLGMLLSLTNKLMYSHQKIKNGIWNRKLSKGFEIKGKTVGIIGYGNTGKSFAKKLTGFNCNIIFYDIKKIFGDKYAKQVDIETLKKKSEIISINVPETNLTRGLIDMKFILSVKNPFWLINTSRGKCVVIKDLLKSLETGKILGLALDVFEFESSSFSSIFNNEKNSKIINQLTKMDNVILSPHVAGSSNESYKKLSKVTLKKILAFYLNSHKLNYLICPLL